MTLGIKRMMRTTRMGMGMGPTSKRETVSKAVFRFQIQMGRSAMRARHCVSAEGEEMIRTKMTAPFLGKAKLIKQWFG
jgi:chromosome condensin MukBEF MukE localization factor